MTETAAECRPSPIGDLIRCWLLIAAAVAALICLPSSSAHRPAHRVPALWVADAVCETGHNPPNWRFHVGVYQGGIAFYWATWDSWKVHVPAARGFADADQAPAWVQARVAQWGLDHYGRWGCLWHADVWAKR